MRPRILLLDEPHQKAREIMDSVAECCKPAYWESDVSGNFAMCEHSFSQYVGIYEQFANGRSKKVNPKNNLKFIATPCTGIDHIDIDYCKQKNIKIIYLDEYWKANKGQEITSTAEHTWSLILQSAKMNQMQLRGKALGIIGFGRVGRQVFRYAESFGMHIYWTDKNQGCSKNTLLTECDIITLHVPLNDSTRGMIGKEQFNMMKPGALLVNTSRQPVVNIDDLIPFLINKKIYYADDFKNDIDLVKYGAIQTHHVAGNTVESRMLTDIYIANKVKEYIQNEV